MYRIFFHSFPLTPFFKDFLAVSQSFPWDFSFALIKGVQPSIPHHWLLAKKDVCLLASIVCGCHSKTNHANISSCWAAADKTLHFSHRASCLEGKTMTLLYPREWLPIIHSIPRPQSECCTVLQDSDSCSLREQFGLFIPGASSCPLSCSLLELRSY